MNNGFYHEYPYRQDVSVSPEMEQVIGAQHINAQVVNSRYEDGAIVADCHYGEQMYTVKSMRFGDNSYWLVIR